MPKCTLRTYVSWVNKVKRLNQFQRPGAERDRQLENLLSLQTLSDACVIAASGYKKLWA